MQLFHWIRQNYILFQYLIMIKKNLLKEYMKFLVYYIIILISLIQ